MIDVTVLGGLLASSGEHGGWWPIWPLLWLVMIGTVVFLVLRRRRAVDGPSDGSVSAESILAERFARGEITREEYRDRLEQLK